jgi:hypothetical protein
VAPDAFESVGCFVDAVDILIVLNFEARFVRLCAGNRWQWKGECSKSQHEISLGGKTFVKSLETDVEFANTVHEVLFTQI